MRPGFVPAWARALVPVSSQSKDWRPGQVAHVIDDHPVARPPLKPGPSILFGVDIWQLCVFEGVWFG